MTVGLFLAVNGYRLIAGKADAVDIMLGVASGKVSEPCLAVWIAANAEAR